MHKRLGLGLVLMLGLAGCGTPYALNGGNYGSMNAFDVSPIVDLPGLPIGTPLNLTGKYQSYDLTGTGQIVALDSTHLSLQAHVTAHVLFFSESKDVTFTVTPNNDPQWPYLFTAVNVTDNQSYVHKGVLVSHTTGDSTFKLDDGTTAALTADGHGNAQVVYGDFNMAIGAASNLPRLLLPIQNPPSREHWFGN